MRRKIFLMLTIALSAFVFSTTALAQQKFSASLNGLQENPPVTTAGRGSCMITLNTAETQITVNCSYSGLTSNVNASHIHGNAAPGANAGVRFPLTNTGGTSGTITNTIAVTPADVAAMRSKLFYVNIHTANFGGGEIRGQVKAANTVFDLEGDGRTDITVFRQSTNFFYTRSSLNGSLIANLFGSGASDSRLAFSGDFDGDGRADPTLIKVVNGVINWSILQSGNNTIRNVQWGLSTDTIVTSDYDGDGLQDIAVFRRTTAIWYILQSSNNQLRAEYFGQANDFAYTGDHDGDGKSDFTILRVEGDNVAWYTRRTSDGTIRKVFWGSLSSGLTTFFPSAPIDVDGDNRQDIMITRAPVGGNREYYVLRSSDNQSYYLLWGLTSDTPQFGDYDGDGKTDFASRRTEGGIYNWYINQSSGTLRTIAWGGTGDLFVEDEDSVIGETTGE